MKLDHAAIRDVIQTAPRDYYAKEQLKIGCEGPFIPSIDDVFSDVCTPASRVLEIGCGNGRTLLRNAHRFAEGIGLDNDVGYLARAHQSREEAKVFNVSFVESRADSVAERFESESFDFVFTERGPFPFSDINTRNAVSVLRQGGALFAENPGPLNYPEPALLFGKDEELPRRVPDHAQLDRAAAEFDCHNVEVRFTANILYNQVFADIYDWLKYHLSAQDYYPQWRFETWPLADTLLRGFDRFAAMTMDAAGRVRTTCHRTWICGVKK